MEVLLPHTPWYVESKLGGGRGDWDNLDPGHKQQYDSNKSSFPSSFDHYQGKPKRIGSSAHNNSRNVQMSTYELLRYHERQLELHQRKVRDIKEKIQP